jgi:hypothetical protein
MLDDWWKRVRSDAPDTSRVAAKEAAFINQHHIEILRIMEESDPKRRGMTVHEIAAAGRLEPYQVFPRMKEMNTLGLICLTNEIRKSPHNRPTRVWVRAEQ